MKGEGGNKERTKSIAESTLLMLTYLCTRRRGNGWPNCGIEFYCLCGKEVENLEIRSFTDTDVCLSDLNP